LDSADDQRPQPVDRLRALFEVLICSDYPTQTLVRSGLVLAGFHAEDAGGGLDLTFVAALSFIDTALLVGLIVFLLRAHGEKPSAVLFGDRGFWREAAAGLPLALVSLGVAIAVLTAIQFLAPSLHTVEHNPLQDLLQSPADAGVFAVVVVIAGGVREEIQRAFLLQRFERWLGGAATGIVVVSAAFGSGHLLQGADAAITTAILGAIWGIVYLRRRSVVAPMVGHSGFNLLQLAQFLVVGR
jgi:membrane protease YdiL (CAAX protease family)